MNVKVCYDMYVYLKVFESKQKCVVTHNIFMVLIKNNATSNISNQDKFLSFFKKCRQEIQEKLICKII